MVLHALIVLLEYLTDCSIRVSQSWSTFFVLFVCFGGKCPLCPLRSTTAEKEIHNY